MASKRQQKPPPPPLITTERAARLARLLTLLDGGPLARAALIRRLKLDVRGFYRDLQLLRTVGVTVELEDGGYSLSGTIKDALGLLPLPDPRLTLREAEQLSRGRGEAHQKLKDLLGRILPE